MLRLSMAYLEATIPIVKHRKHLERNLRLLACPYASGRQTSLVARSLRTRSDAVSDGLTLQMDFGHSLSGCLAFVYIPSTRRP